MSIYADKVKAHLADYRLSELRVTEDGVHRKSGRTYAHILPEAQHRLNILEGIRDPFWRYFEDNAATLGLHTDFHHLNSSQAFAFNLLFPWASEAANQPLLAAALGMPAEEFTDWGFERVLDGHERTNVDFFAKQASGRCVCVEVKLTEGHFGAVDPKPSHITKRDTHYAPALAGKLKPGVIESSDFFFHYQLCRNVSLLDLTRGDRLVLVVPRANAVPWMQAETFLGLLEPDARAAVTPIDAGDLAARLAGGAANERLQNHMAALRRKYPLD